MSGAGVEVLVIIFIGAWLIIACIKCGLRAERQQQEEASAELRDLRERRAEARRQANGQAQEGQPQQNASHSPAPAPSAPDLTESRNNVVRSNLFFRSLENADSIRTLSVVLAAANDRYETDSQREDSGNVIARTWRAAEGSVRKVLGGPSSHECCICLDGYNAGETVCWSKEDECDHIFHEDCICEWLQNNDDCPLCRAKLIHQQEPEA